MTIADVIAGILDREGGFVDNPADKGGPTKYGVAARTLGDWRKLGRPATRAEVMALDVAEAALIARERYVKPYGFDRIAYEPLMAQLVDFGYNSGPERATRWLQRVLGVPVTGRLDDRTRKMLDLQPPRLVNDALVAARLFMIDDFTDSHLDQKQFEEGLESRALTFFLSRPAPTEAST